MKFLCLLFFVALGQGFVLEDVRVKRSSELPAPKITSLEALDPADVQLQWTPVTSDDRQDPVLGYKLKVWERPNVKTYKYKTINGVKTLVEESIPAKMTDNKIPAAPPKEYITDKTIYRVKGLKFGVWYDFRVSAYSKNKESPLSEPSSIILYPNEHTKDLYETV